MNKTFKTVLIMGLISWIGTASAADLKSASKLAFGPENILFVADWKEAKIHAVTLPAATSSSEETFNLTDIDKNLEKTLGATKVNVEDMAVRPGTAEVYMTVSYGAEKSPAVVVIHSNGVMKRLDLQALHETSASLNKAPNTAVTFWDRIPERSLTVTDMKWHKGKLYIAGLSSDTFASTLRILSYPFDGKETISSVEMYHTSHNETETRAPIRAMTFAELDGKDYMIAAYVCTPLVTIPVDEFKDGAHITGKTIAELGYGNTPQSLLNYSVKGQDGSTQSFILVANVERNAENIPLSSIEAANDKPGLSKPVNWGNIEGVDAMPAPLSGIIAIDNLNDNMFIAARRNLSSGELQLVTMGKQFKIRLSDFVSEYDFPSYAYSQGFQTNYIKPVQDQMMKQEGFAKYVK